MTDKKISIFISSPSDVLSERKIARDVVDRLKKSYSYHCKVEAILWESEPLVATDSFQGSIPKPSDADIVVVILWSKLGTLLPDKSEYRDVDGNRLTGTEWEFLEAKYAYETSADKSPNLLVYKKTNEIELKFQDISEAKNVLSAKERLDYFWKKWFEDTDGSLIAGYTAFSKIDEFEDILEEHLRSSIRKKLIESGVKEPDLRESKWDDQKFGSPFKELSSFEVQDANIFFGRTKATYEVIDLLRKQIDNNKPSVMVVGSSGSGKSSLVKAGVISVLKEPDSIGKVTICRHAIMRPSDYKDDSVYAFVKALSESHALPEISNSENETYRLVDLAKNKPELFFKELSVAVKNARESHELKNTEDFRIIFLIDQFEEVFTYCTEKSIIELTKIIEGVFNFKQIWFFTTLRSDFLYHLDNHPKLKELLFSGKYFLDPPSPNEFSQIIRKPAKLAGLVFEEDSNIGITLALELQREAERDPHALPLLEFTLNLLYERRSSEGVLSFADYRNIGGLDGSITKRANSIVASLDDSEKKILPSILLFLITISKSDSTPTAIWVERNEVDKNNLTHSIIDKFLAQRLFIADSKGGKVKIRLTHEALIKNWGFLKDKIANAKRFLIFRHEIFKVSLSYSESLDSDLLLKGRRLNEAKEYIEVFPDEWTTIDRKFINDSIEKYSEEESKEKKRLEKNAELANEKARIAMNLAKQRKTTARIIFLGLLFMGFLATVTVYYYFDANISLNKFKKIEEINRKINDTSNLISKGNIEEGYKDLKGIEEDISVANINDQLKADMLEDLAMEQKNIFERIKNKEWGVPIKNKPDKNKEMALDSIISSVDNLGFVRGILGTDSAHLGYANSLEAVSNLFVSNEKDEVFIKKLNEPVYYLKEAIDSRLVIYNNDKLKYECPCIISSLYYQLAVYEGKENDNKIKKYHDLARNILKDSMGEASLNTGKSKYLGFIASSALRFAELEKDNKKFKEAIQYLQGAIDLIILEDNESYSYVENIFNEINLIFYRIMRYSALAKQKGFSVNLEADYIVNKIRFIEKATAYDISKGKLNGEDWYDWLSGVDLNLEQEDKGSHTPPSEEYIITPGDYLKKKFNL